MSNTVQYTIDRKALDLLISNNIINQSIKTEGNQENSRITVSTETLKNIRKYYKLKIPIMERNFALRNITPALSSITQHPPTLSKEEKTKRLETHFLELNDIMNVVNSAPTATTSQYSKKLKLCLIIILLAIAISLSMRIE